MNGNYTNSKTRLSSWRQQHCGPNLSDLAALLLSATRCTRSGSWTAETTCGTYLVLSAWLAMSSTFTTGGSAPNFTCGDLLPSARNGDLIDFCNGKPRKVLKSLLLCTATSILQSQSTPSTLNSRS